MRLGRHTMAREVPGDLGSGQVILGPADAQDSDSVRTFQERQCIMDRARRLGTAIPRDKDLLCQAIRPIAVRNDQDGRTPESFRPAKDLRGPRAHRVHFLGQ